MVPASIAVLLLVAAGVPAGGWPVDVPEVVSGFRPPAADWLTGHRGIDLAARTGDIVRAMVAGHVDFAGTVAGKPVVVIALPGAGGRRLTYEPVLAHVRAGDAVRAGQPVGTVAAVGGHCGGTAGCLHVGLRTHHGYADPRILVDREPAVLKPIRRPAP